MAAGPVIYARVAVEVHDRVKDLAARSGCSMTVVVDILLRRALDLPNPLQSLDELLGEPR